MVLAQIKSKGTLADKAYNVLKDAIMSLDLKPGEVLLEDNLSDRLGISRTPIRAALQRLSFEGLIGVSPGKGTYVTELSTEYFLDLFSIRESLEILSVKLASINRTENDIKMLKGLIEKHLIIAQEVPLNTKRYLELDRNVHMLLASISKNVLLEKMILQINESYNRYLHFTNFEGRAVTVVKEHLLIAEAIEARDSIGAQRLIKDHINDVKESILLSLMKLNHY